MDVVPGLVGCGVWRSLLFLGGLVAIAGCGSASNPGADSGVAVPLEGGTASDLTVAPPDLTLCGGACSGATPFCDVPSGRCVACRTDGDCGGGLLCAMGACAPGCSPQHACGDAGVCQLDGGVCIECLRDADCLRLKDKNRTVCGAHTGKCGPCSAANDICPPGSYCKEDGFGMVACVAGCKGDIECRLADGGGASSACCDHVCTDTSRSASHCGACGNGCGGGADAACCSSMCVHTQSDVKACGGCGMACALPNAMPACVAGGCQVAKCSPGFADCNANAADGCEVGTQSDVRNCGVCGKGCMAANAMPACVFGDCGIAACNPKFKDCDGMFGNGCEIDVGSDVKNCGSCGNDCGALPHAVAACAAGVCTIGACAQGFGDCNQMNLDGCETPTSSDVKNCGKCGTACPMPANVIMSCTNGACASGGCVAGFGECDNNANNGCEAKLTTDLNNCGVCGKVCMGMGMNAVAACVNSGCTLACNPGYFDCDGNPGNGCEIFINGDSKNCGKCGLVCAANKVCGNGMCVDPGACPPNAFFTGALPASLTGSLSWSFGSFTFDGAGNLLAVVAYNPNSLYSVSAQTNKVTVLTALPLGKDWVSVTYSAANNTVYVGSAQSDIHSFNLTSMMQAPVVNLGIGSINTLAIAPPTFGAYGGQLMAGSANGFVVAWDINKVMRTNVAAAAGTISAMAFHSSGVLYAANYDNRINKILPNGMVSQFVLLASIDGLVVDETRNRLYVADSSLQRLRYVNLNNASITDFPGVYNFDSGYYPTPLAYDCAGTLLYAVDPGGPTKVLAVSVPP